MNRTALTYGLYAGLVVIILTLTGIFDTFESRFVIANRLSLDVISLVLMMGIPTVILVRKLLPDNPAQVPLYIAGMIPSVIVSLSLVVMIAFESAFAYPDIRFVFQNYQRIIGTNITFGLEEDQLIIGILLLIALGAIVGLVTTYFATRLPRTQQMIVLPVGLTIIIGLMESQVRALITLPDALTIALALVGGYIIARTIKPTALVIRLAIGLIWGAILGAILTMLVQGGALEEGGFLLMGARRTIILGGTSDPFLPYLLGFGLTGAVGALLTTASGFMHNAALMLMGLLVALGIVNWQGRMTDLAAGMILILFIAIAVMLPRLSRDAVQTLRTSGKIEQTGIRRISGLMIMAVILIAPLIMGQYITNILDLVMLYIIMGIGLNVMVGYAGLLDLGYVASFAIGAYTCALLTTPSIITQGCVPMDVVEGMRHAPMCTGILENWQGTGLFSFWGSWPVAVVVSAFTGMMLGIPVLRLRGDYLAIVTLGFGEITRVLTRANATRPLLGSAQGIPNVPYPVLDLTALNPEWYIEFSNATSIYYLYVFGVLIAAFVVMQLAGSRLGRAWRAIRADEDVAEAMGINLVLTKLLAFGVSSAFAGLGGAIFAAQLRGIFPDSFTILVSINVLSLIIIGGLGSIPGVIVGALMLVGMPEILRELQSYRLLAFGSLLVIAMLLKPDGLLPPAVRQLSERVTGTSNQPKPQGDDA